MKYVKFYVSAGYPSTTQEEIVEFEDDVTEDEIEEAYQDWKAGVIDDSWWECDEEGNEL